MVLTCPYKILQDLHALRLAPLKVKALADSKLAVWQREDSNSNLPGKWSLRICALMPSMPSSWRIVMAHRCEDLGSILAFDNFDGAVEQDSKATRPGMQWDAWAWHHEISWNIMNSWTIRIHYNLEKLQRSHEFRRLPAADIGSGPEPSICLHLRHPVYGAAETLNAQWKLAKILRHGRASFSQILVKHILKISSIWFCIWLSIL